MGSLFIYRTNSTEEILKANGYLPKDDTDGLENVQETNDLFNKMKFLEFVIFFYSWIGVACSMVAYELRYND
jgi:hypothetical protein